MRLTSSATFCARLLALLAGAAVFSSAWADDLPAAAPLPTVKLLAPDPVALEGSTTGAFTLIRDGATDAALDIDVLIGGTAVNGVDYAKIGDRVTIPAGFLAVDIIVQPLAVSVSPTDKRVVLTLVSNAAYELGRKKSATVVIAEDRFNDLPPVVRLTAPADGAVLTVPAVQLTAEAADKDDAIAKVSFYAGDNLLGSVTQAPFTFIWTTPRPGPQTLLAKATDTAGLVGFSAPVKVTFSNTPPVVSLTSPVDGASFPADSHLKLAAEATDANDAVAKVSFFANGRLIGSVAQPPYALVWSNVPPGRFEVVAKAEDGFGADARSKKVRIIVSNAPPVVVLTSPVDGSVFGLPAHLTFAAEAKDPDGTVRKVSFYAGERLLGTVSNAPYAVTWSNVPAGSHVVIARAIDNHGAVGVSRPVALKVNNVLPTVKLTAPASGAELSGAKPITLTAEAADADGSVKRVSFYANDRLLGSVTAVPYAFTWKEAKRGQYVLTARATDDQGGRTTSEPVKLTVTR